MRPKFSTILFCLILPLGAPAQDLSFSLTPAIQSGDGTNEVVFTGAFTNTSLTTNFLNNIQVNLTNTATNYLTADTNIFFANVPGILLPGETYSGVVFGIVINPATPPGNYSGTVTIQGGTDIFAAGDLTNQTFQISMPTASLSIAVSAGNLLISWPSPPGDFVLQQNSNLTTNNWTTATNTPTTTNFQSQIILLPADRVQFFRLQYP
jgi:hypothetical protein